MNTKLRVANLLISILTPPVMFAGLIFPLYYGLPMTFVDILIILFDGVDGTHADQWVTGAGWILLFVFIMAAAAGLLFIFGIIAFFTTKRPLFRLSTAFLIIDDALVFIATALQYVCAVWLNSQYNNPTTRVEQSGLYYIAPAVQTVILIAMIVLTVFSIRSMRKEKDFQDMLRTMKERNS